MPAMPAMPAILGAELVVRAVSLDDPTARGLEAAHIAEMHQRYDREGPNPLDAADFEPPAGCFLVGFAGGLAVACGGWRHRTDEIAEVKRMYVVPAARRQGCSRLLLAAIEEDARRAGYVEAWLETGALQPEALGLYRSAGYHSIPPYGEFRADPRSRSFAKSLVDP